MGGYRGGAGRGGGGGTNQELASDEDEHAVVGRGLGVEGRDLVLDLLEGEALWNAKNVSPAEVPATSNDGARGRGVRICTASFSTMALMPRTEADSKVSMDSFLYFVHPR